MSTLSNKMAAREAHHQLQLPLTSDTAAGRPLVTPAVRLPGPVDAVAPWCLYQAGLTNWLMAWSAVSGYPIGLLPVTLTAWTGAAWSGLVLSGMSYAQSASNLLTGESTSNEV